MNEEKDMNKKEDFAKRSADNNQRVFDENVQYPQIINEVNEFQFEQLFAESLFLFASSKTYRYFLHPEDSFDNRVKKVVNTCFALMQFDNANALLQVGSSYYVAGNYMLPDAMCEVIASARCFVSDENIGIKDPYYHASFKHDPEYVISPLQVQQIFNLYNANQEPEYRVHLSNVHYENNVLLDYKYLYDSGKYFHFNPNGKYDEFITTINKIPSFEHDTNKVELHSLPTREEIELWMLGKGKSIKD